MLEVEKLNFSEVVGLVNEPNRCSGGAKSIRHILQNVYLKPGSTIVELGSNTGFSSLEFAVNRPDCRVIGVDINEKSVAESNRKAESFGVDNAEFVVGNLFNSGLEDKSVDLLFISNVTSFVNEREAALEEYRRILKPNGHLAFIPIYYHEEPEPAIKHAVEEAIGAKLSNNTIDYWKSLIEKVIPGATLYYQEDFKYDDLSLERIKNYTDFVIENGATDVDAETKAQLNDRLQYFFRLFNDNLRSCQFSVMLYRNSKVNWEPELHTSYSVSRQ
jgi:ubiquinone/menaquinone biosynthesis C-methylase UbiE